MFSEGCFFGIERNTCSGNRYIEDMIENGMNDTDILSCVMDEDFVETVEIIDNAENSIHELYLREEGCDIKITDYIEENYKEEQLFYSKNHPNERLLNEYVNRLVEYLGYKRRRFSIVDILINCGSLKGQDMPVYPCVVKALGLKRWETEYYPDRYTEK